MGRRAADLTTPVPVLGIPALVGVHAWKTTGGDRSGGALLQTWGLQCSVGVQTSPGISRPPTELPDTLSDNITQTSNGYITKKAKEILPLTRSDNEKKAILKQKTGKSKIKKEVTFKACGGDASKDVACCQRNSGGTYCYARAIKSNSLIAGTVTSGRPKLKSGPRYTNGSVVDSEAIGGISVVNDETEPVKGVVSHGSDLHNHYADQPGKMLPLSTARPFAISWKICKHCGGRQSIISRAAKENSPTPYSYLAEKPLQQPFTAVSTNSHLQVPHIEKDLKSNQQASQSILNTDKRTQVTLNPQILHLNELRNGQTAHPAGPMHSGCNLANLSNGQAASDATSIQPTTILHKTITVTKAMTESRQDVKCFAKFPQNTKMNFPTSLSLIPEMTAATKSNNSLSQIYPQLFETTHHNLNQDGVSQNVCVSVHATPENTLSPSSYMYTVAMGAGNTSTTDVHKSKTTLKPKAGSINSNAANVNAQLKTLNSIQKAQISKGTKATNSPKVHPKYPVLSLSTDIIDHTDKSEPSVHLTSASPSLYPHKSQEEPTSSHVSTSPSKITDTVVSSPTFANPPHNTSPYSLVSTLNHKAISDQMMSVSTKLKSVDARINLTQTNPSNSEPALHVSASSLCTTSSAFKPIDSRAKFPTREVLCSTNTQCNGTSCKNITRRTIAFDFRKPKASADLLPSPRTEKQSNVLESSPTLLQSKELSCNEATNTSEAHHTQATDISTQESNEPDVWGAIPSQESKSTTLLMLSGPQNVSESHDRGIDASSRNHKQTINPYEKLYSDINKFSGNLLSELVLHESKHQENTNLLQVTRPQSYMYLIKSNSSSLQGCLNTEQQKLAHYQGCTGTDHEGHCATSLTVKPSQHKDSNTQQFSLGDSARDANSKFKSNTSNTNKQAHPNYSSSLVTPQTNCKAIISPKDTKVKAITQSSACQNSGFDTTLLTQAHTSPEQSVTMPAPFNSEGELCAQMGPEHNSIMPSSTLRLASSPCLQSSKEEAISEPVSKFNPAPTQLCPEDTSLAHSHPVDAALFLPPSTQYCKSALQQRLEAVEASLAANKGRITTLLDIIHDLETCCTPTGRRQCCKTGQDRKNCSTFQKTACIVYSVEYDFRQQERRFLDVLNRSAGGNNSFSTHLARPLNFSLLRNVMIKNLTKTKLKSKKFGKTLLKWLPRKIQQV
ncbi:uncharacterized protein PAE49_018243 isoform 1-T3 [Odontesthes bonariensis]|uniref:uncharacterized protein LOC142401065 n=1 Tax=Odontesthes bonariensis TaxID=219752 RepID=UPI003F586959